MSMSDPHDLSAVVPVDQTVMCDEVMCDEGHAGAWPAAHSGRKAKLS